LTFVSLPTLGIHNFTINKLSIRQAEPIIDAFANWTGVVPGAKQSSETESKGLRMTKAGPAVMKWALYQSGQIGRQWDPQLAAVYYRQMVYHGKTHKQAMGAVMSHVGARVFTVLREDRPYELRDAGGKPISNMAARAFILAKYQVPEDIRKERLRSKGRKANTSRAAKKEGALVGSVHEATRAPQAVATKSPPNT